MASRRNIWRLRKNSMKTFILQHQENQHWHNHIKQRDVTFHGYVNYFSQSDEIQKTFWWISNGSIQRHVNGDWN